MSYVLGWALVGGLMAAIVAPAAPEAAVCDQLGSPAFARAADLSVGRNSAK